MKRWNRAVEKKKPLNVLETIIVLVPIIGFCIHNEHRLTRIENKIESVMNYLKKINGNFSKDEGEKTT
jgi:hypothetical protein